VKAELRGEFHGLWKEVFPDIDPVEYSAGEGCIECSGTSYKGRVAIGEVLIVNDDIKDIVISGAGERQIYDLALQKGMRPMFIDGFEKVLRGVTSFDEILRVTTAP